MVGQYENGSFILLTLVPPRVPHLARLHIILSLQVFCCPDLFFKNRSCSTEAARCSTVRGQIKSGGSRGQSLFEGVRGQSPVKLTLFRG